MCIGPGPESAIGYNICGMSVLTLNIPITMRGLLGIGMDCGAFHTQCLWQHFVYEQVLHGG